MHMVVTGATGFIGRAVVAAALSRGHTVTAIVRDAEKARAVLPEHTALKHALASDLAGVDPQNVLAGDDALIHLAWQEVGKYTDPGNLLGNLKPQFLFLQSMVNAGLNNVTVGGSCLEYGLQEGEANEKDTAAPVTYYGLAKKTLYDMLALFLPDTVALKWLRYFYVYGDGQRPQAIIPQLLAAIARGDKEFNMSPGDQGRDFIHVDTAAFNTVLAAEQRDVTGVINIGNGRALTVNDLVQDILAAHKCDMALNRGFYSYPAYEPFSFWADTKKMLKIEGVKADDKICV